MRLLLRWTTLVLCGLATAPLPAQEGRATVKSPDAPQQEPRPEAQRLRVPAVNPKLEAVLVQWHNKTKGIQKLHGEHRRWSYEKTFSVAMVSSGKFYFEAPDKGRIDITPDDEKIFTDEDAKATGVQVKGVDGNIYTLKPDQPERWICDGQQVVKIDDVAKTYEVLPITKEQQGASIMDGPLPFLFGLPPDKAKQRYEMTLVAHDDKIVRLSVKPKLRFDAASWQTASVMLRADTFLPSAVMLLDPAGNRITVFSFGEPDVNPVNFLAFLGVNNPFRPTLIGYKQVQSQAPEAGQALNLNGQPIEGVPAVIGMKHGDAKNVLGQRGYQNLRIVPDKTPSDAKFRWLVKEQSPPPNAAAPPEQEITLVLYVTEEDLQKLEKKAEAP